MAHEDQEKGSRRPSDGKTIEDRIKTGLEEEELNEALRRLGLMDWTVVWNQKSSGEERGTAYPDTRIIVIHDKDREAALETLIHEFLEVKMKGLIRPYLATVNALLKALEKIYYAEKEKTIDDLTPLLLRTLREDLIEKDEETKAAAI